MGSDRGADQLRPSSSEKTECRWRVPLSRISIRSRPLGQPDHMRLLELAALLARRREPAGSQLRPPSLERRTKICDSSACRSAAAAAPRWAARERRACHSRRLKGRYPAAVSPASFAPPSCREMRHGDAAAARPGRQSLRDSPRRSLLGLHLRRQRQVANQASPEISACRDLAVPWRYPADTSGSATG